MPPMIPLPSATRRCGLEYRTACLRASPCAWPLVLLLLKLHHAVAFDKNQTSCAAPTLGGWYGGEDHSNQLLSATMLSDVHLVDKLAAMGADLKAVDGSGATALHVAALHGHRQIVDRLIQGRAAVSTRDELGWTPLHVAAGRGHSIAVELLLKVDISLTCAHDVDGHIPRDLVVLPGANTPKGEGQKAALQKLLIAEKDYSQRIAANAGVPADTMVWHRCEWRPSCILFDCPNGTRLEATARQIACSSFNCTEPEDVSTCCFGWSNCQASACPPGWRSRMVPQRSTSAWS
eukprot:TRINITY_DN5362_c0_g1_i3.p1 TRINITY_DN5362_c0_g1~~TRINITY_DN5362_c0_g1_i3.p1  ORF type:complete len:291 (-),score=41.09 TRINITY_DN5362_c0_g1_i3:326-1198(-)